MPRKTPPPSETKSGTKSVRASEPAQRPDETPVDYMLRVMRDPKADKKRRDTMAKSATPFIHARPAAKKKRANSGEARLKRQLESARETLAGKIAQLRSESG
jgi:hypothetical protein